MRYMARLHQPVSKKFIGRQSSPYPLSSVILGFYTLTIIVLSKNPALVDISQYIGIGLAGVFFAEHLIARDIKLLFPTEFASFLCFLAILTVSALWARSPDVAITICFTFLQLLVFGVVAVNILFARRSIKPVVIGAVAGLVWAVGIAFYENGWWPTYNDGYARIASVLFNANAYAITLSIGCMFAWYLYQNSASKLFKLILAITAFLFIYQIIFFTGSRKGILSLVWMMTIYLFISHAFQSKSSLSKLILKGLFLIIILTALWWAVAQSPFYDRMLRLQTDILEGTRTDMARLGLDLWRERPLFGQGANQFRVIYFRPTYSHNNYIELLANNGLIGLFTFYSFFILLARRYLRAAKSGGVPPFLYTWSLSFMAMLLFLDIGVVSYYSKQVWLAYIVLVALGYMLQFGEKPILQNSLGDNEWRVAPKERLTPNF